MEYKLKQPVYSQTSGCGGPGDCATKQIMNNSKIQNKINNLSGGSSERGPVVPNVVGSTEQQNNLFAKVSKLSVDMQENSKYDNEVGMAPKKGGSRRKVTKKRRCCKLCGRRCANLCTHRCKCKCLPCDKRKTNRRKSKRRKTKRRNKSKRRKTRVKKGRGWPFSKSGWPFSKSKKESDDESELDKHWGLDGERYKIKGRKPQETEVNMSFAPWEEGFTAENNDPYGDGPFLEKVGDYNRVVSRKPGTRSWPMPANVELARAYNRVEKAVEKNK